MALTHYRSAAVVIALIAATAGCHLILPEDDYPDEYEEAIIELLDDSDVVAGHGAQVDGWARAANVPDQDAPVQLVDTVTRDQWYQLLMQLADLADDHDQPIPPLTYEVEEFGDLTVAGHYSADEADQLLDVTTGTGWQQLIAWLQEDGARIHLNGGVQDAAEGAELVNQPLPPLVADHLDNLQVGLPEGMALERVDGKEGPIHHESFALAFALDELSLELPSTQDSLTFRLITEHHGIEPIVVLDTDVHSEELRAADPDDRPALAAELGYQEVCEQTSTLLMEHVNGLDGVARCRASHVDIS